MKAKIDPARWFLAPRDDIRSCDALEDVATEFDVQGLELDWAGACWDASFRRVNGKWSANSCVGARWQSVRDEARPHYLANTYRVLLTRARQGMVILVPKGDVDDHTRVPAFTPSFASSAQSCSSRTTSGPSIAPDTSLWKALPRSAMIPSSDCPTSLPDRSDAVRNCCASAGTYTTKGDTLRKGEATLRKAKSSPRWLLTGGLACEVPRCKWDFSETYGELGAGFYAGNQKLNQLAAPSLREVLTDFVNPPPFRISTCRARGSCETSKTGAATLGGSEPGGPVPLLSEMATLFRHQFAEGK